MDVYRTEEEQIAAIKGWWQRNGIAVLVAAVLAVGVYAGWNWYRHYQLEQSLAASTLYRSMMESLQQASTAGQAGSDAAERVVRAGEELITKHGGSVYAQFAALMLAGGAVANDDLTGAEKYLRQALGQKPDPALRALATDRLARVVSAQGRHDEALALLDDDVPAMLVAARSEVRGDILFAQGKRAEAAAAWKAALDAAPAEDPARGVLEMKVDYASAE